MIMIMSLSITRYNIVSIFYMFARKRIDLFPGSGNGAVNRARGIGGVFKT